VLPLHRYNTWQQQHTQQLDCLIVEKKKKSNLRSNQNMSFIFNIPEDVIISLLSDWIVLIDLVVIDSAVCQLSERKIFLEIICNPKLLVSNKFKSHIDNVHSCWSSHFFDWCSGRNLNFKELVLFGRNFILGNKLSFKINLSNVNSLILHECNVNQLSAFELVDLFNSCENLIIFQMTNVDSLSNLNCSLNFNKIVLQNLQVYRMNTPAMISSLTMRYLLSNFKYVTFLKLSLLNTKDTKTNLESEFVTFVKINPQLETFIVQQWGNIDTCFKFSFDIILKSLATTSRNLKQVELLGFSTVSKTAICHLFKQHGESLIKVDLANRYFGDMEFWFSFRQGVTSCKNIVDITDSSPFMQDNYKWIDIFAHMKPVVILNLVSCHSVTNHMLLDFGNLHKSSWETLNIRNCDNIKISVELRIKLILLCPKLKSFRENCVELLVG
jgi:hypothetical protein